LPTMDELKTIYNRNPENPDGRHFTNLIDITGAWVWGSEGWGNIWAFDFSRGSPAVGGSFGHGFYPDLSSARALPVRDAKHMKARVVVKDERRDKKGIASTSRKTVVASLGPGPTLSKPKEIAVTSDS